mmetsp:Transcript_19201/g.50139  ORF Transcript_19201/g.50139 Transcript_19201/m.50139 type:complete len:262 (-) Transcript_19201:81-866(-)
MLGAQLTVEAAHNLLCSEPDLALRALAALEHLLAQPLRLVEAVVANGVHAAGGAGRGGEGRRLGLDTHGARAGVGVGAVHAGNVLVLEDGLQVVVRHLVEVGDGADAVGHHLALAVEAAHVAVDAHVRVAPPLGLVLLHQLRVVAVHPIADVQGAGAVVQLEAQAGGGLLRMDDPTHQRHVNELLAVEHVLVVRRLVGRLKQLLDGDRPQRLLVAKLLGAARCRTGISLAGQEAATAELGPAGLKHGGHCGACAEQDRWCD